MTRRWWTWLVTAALLLFCVGCRQVSAERDPGPVPHPAVTGREDVSISARDADAPAIGFTVISRYNPRAMVLGYQPMVDYLTASTPYRFQLVLSRDYAQAVERLCTGEVLLASLGGMTCVEAHRQCGALPLVRPRSARGTPYYFSKFIVREDSPLRRLADLRGKRVAFPSPLSTSGSLVSIHDLLAAGIRLSDLGEYRFLMHHDAVAKAVLLGEVDAGAVKDVVAERFLPAGLRVIHVSDPIPSVPIVAAPACPSAVREAVRKALLAVAPAQSANWDVEFVHGFVPAAWEDYVPLQEMEDALRRKGLQPGRWRP